MKAWIVYALRMIDYKIVGWRWHFRPPHPSSASTREHASSALDTDTDSV